MGEEGDGVSGGGEVGVGLGFGEGEVRRALGGWGRKGGCEMVQIELLMSREMKEILFETGK